MKSFWGLRTGWPQKQNFWKDFEVRFFKQSNTHLTKPAQVGTVQKVTSSRKAPEATHNLNANFPLNTYLT